MYTTLQGDTWDKIALKVYGSEFYLDFLMSNNLKLIDTFIFSDGIKLNTPELPVSQSSTLPDWRK